MAQKAESPTPATPGPNPPKAASRTAKTKKVKATASNANATRAARAAGPSQADATVAVPVAVPSPTAPVAEASGQRETTTTSPVPSSSSSSECGDLDLVPPPRRDEDRLSLLLARVRGSPRAAMLVLGTLAVTLLGAPLVALAVSSKMGAWHGGPWGQGGLYLCNDSVCHAEAHYFDDKLDAAVGPCDDYYAHVCSARWHRVLPGSDLRAAPYASQSSGYAYQALRQLATAYAAQDAERMHQSRHHFGHQTLLFVASCVQESSRSSREMESLSSVLRYLDLEGWPYDRAPRERKSVAHSAGKLAGSLAVFPFVAVDLQRLQPRTPPEDEEDSQQQQRPQEDRLLIVFGQARLLLSLHEHMDDSRAMDWYRESVGRAIRVLYRGHEQDKIVDALLELERRLARAIESLPTRKSPPFYRVTLGSVPGGVLWDWVSFLNGVLKGSAAAGAHQPVAVRSMLFLHRLARITHDTPAAVLLNYLGYRLLVAVAPFLQSPATEHLVPLSVEGLRIPGMERLQACGQLAEKVFGAALTVMLRHATPGLHHADMARKMVGLVNSAADALERFLKQAPWLSAAEEDLNSTLSRLSQTSVSLGVPLGLPGEAELGQLFADVPALNERSLLESYFHMKTAIQRRHWAALKRDSQDDHRGVFVGSMHGVSSFDIAYGYDPERNSVLLPYGVLGFLLHVQDVLPMHVPRFLHHVLRGLFATVADMQTAHDSPEHRRPSWSRATSLRFAHASWCFLRQYSEALSSEAGSSRAPGAEDLLAEAVEDNAVLEPLYRVYVRSFPLRGGRPALFRLPTLHPLSADELFFVNFALGHCSDPQSTGMARQAGRISNGTAARQMLSRERLPAKLKVNVPLSNSERFSRVYGCKKGSPMNPAQSCSLWTAAG
ncbi:neprilysin-1-like [Haemaphysalis longicornis]